MIRLRALGQCVVEVGEHHVTPESDVLFALLVVLASNAGRLVPRAWLLNLFWPDAEPSKARHRLRQALYQAKRLGARILTRGPSVTIGDTDCEIDYVVRACSREPLASSAFEVNRLEFLPHYAPAISWRLSKWVESERDRVNGLVRHWLLRTLSDSLSRFDYSNVSAIARACLHLDPFNSAATFALAESLALDGHAADAVTLLDEYGKERGYSNAELVDASLSLRRRITEIGRNRSRRSVSEAPLVGRDDLLRDLGAWLGNDPGQAQVLVLVGEPGIGKSRLLAETVRVATMRGRRCVEYRSTAAVDHHLAGLLDLLPQLLALPGAVGCAPDSYSRLIGLTQGINSDGSVPSDTPDSAFRFAVLRRSVRDLLEAVIAESEVLLVIDDCHALDLATLEVLLHSTQTVGPRLQLLMALRPVGSTASMLMNQKNVRTVRVLGLNQNDSRDLLVRELSPKAAYERASLIDWAVDLANGNPFYLVELATHCRGDDPTEALPASLQIALERGLDSLSPAARIVVQACAVLAHNATLARLDGALDLPPHTSAAALGELEMAGLISLIDGRVVRCRHDLIADAVLRQLTKVQLGFLHKRAATVLHRDLVEAPTVSLAWDCALHWDAAGENSKAFDVTLGIADQLLFLGLPSASADLCIKAARYCSSADQNAKRLLRLGRALRLLEDWTGVIDALVARHALGHSESRRTAESSEAQIALIEARWWRDHDGGLLGPLLRRVEDKTAPTLHRLQTAVVALIIADNHQRRGLAKRIVDDVEATKIVTDQESLERVKSRLVYHTAFGDLDVAVTAGESLLSQERERNASAALLRVLRWYSIPLRYTGEKARAISVLMEAYSRAAHLGLQAEMWNAAEYLAILGIDTNDVELASRWAPLCLELAGPDGAETDKGVLSKLMLSRVALAIGDIPQATHFLHSARGPGAVPILKTRVRETEIALDVMLRLRSATPISARILDKLTRLHVVTRESGTRDFETGALCLGLAASERVVEGRRLLDAYMEHFRRVRLPIQPVLTEATVLLGATALVGASA